MSKKREERQAASLQDTWYGESFETGFVHDRPFGAGDDRFHLFHFRASVNLRDGESEKTFTEGSCVIYPPQAPQRFCPVATTKAPLVCDHVPFPARDAKGLKRLNIPINRVFTLRNSNTLMVAILALQREEYHRQLHWSSMAQEYRKIIVHLLSRALARQDSPVRSSSDNRANMAIKELCARIDRHPAHPWMVMEMAGELNMSRSRFSRLFKNFIGMAPQDYIISARLQEARHLLTNTSLRVSEVAQRCGFNSTHYMSRLFSNRVGCPPSRYAEQFQLPEKKK